MSNDELPPEPAPDPHPQPSWASSFSSGDLLAGGPVERPRRNVAAIVISLVAVLAVIGGAVGYVGYHKLASSGSQPDQWAPANSIAYLKLDFDPAASEKVAAWRFEQKFPDAPHVTSADQLKDALLDDVLNDPNIDYATDVKPWLGNRVALAVYPDASGAGQVVGILAVKDAAAAKIGLTKVAQAEQQGDECRSDPGGLCDRGRLRRGGQFAEGRRRCRRRGKGVEHHHFEQLQQRRRDVEG